MSTSIVNSLGMESGVTMLDPSRIEPNTRDMLSSLESPPDCSALKILSGDILWALIGNRAETDLEKDPRIREAKSFMSRVPDRKSPISVIAREVGTLGKPSYSSFQRTDRDTYFPVSPVEATH